MAWVDFRSVVFEEARVVRLGKNIGGASYWKLFYIENVLRVMLNSILLNEVGPNWWQIEATDDSIKRNVSIARDTERKKPHHASPGRHDIYCITLSNIVAISKRHADKIRPIITDIDQVNIDLEQIKVPRNLVGHMNWLNHHDREVLRRAYFVTKRLLGQVEDYGYPLIVP